MTSGVRILGPTEGPVVYHGMRLVAGPPWPDSIKSPAGELPEFVVEESGKWVPFHGPGGFRARVDIVLVMDGKVIDTNHIEIPAHTPIIDRRAKK